MVLDGFSLSAAIVESVVDLPYAIAYFGSALLLYALCLVAYVGIAPGSEFSLIREGNSAAAASLAGAMLGFALPLGSVMAVSGSMFDMLVWSFIALVLQLITVAVLRRMMPSLSRNVGQGQVASGVFLGALAVAVGILNAAAMSF
jgi:putative membrane protein